MENNDILDLYPMIHRDKLIYLYTDSIIRIGTDDNDVIEVKTSPQWYPVLQKFDGDNTIRKILHIFSWVKIEDLSLIIVKLSNSGVLSLLEDSFSNIAENHRYESDLVYYYSEGFDGKEIIKKLEHLSVTIFGCGGGGSLLAIQLANLGIKRLHLVDFDLVSTSNLNRQFLFESNDVGLYKVDCIKKYIEKRHRDTEVTVAKKRIDSVKSAVDEIDNSNWVFCCMDEPPYIAQRIINRASYIKKVPSLYGFSSRDSAKLVIVKPNTTGCIDCLLNSRDSDSFRNLITSLANSNFKPTTPIIIPNMMMEVSWMIKKWLDSFINKDNSNDSVLFRFDYNNFCDEKFIIFERQIECPTCGTLKGNNELWNLIPIN